MQKFIAYNPTKVHFGKGVTETLSQYSVLYGRKVLLIYGKGSALRNGSYEAVRKQLDKAGSEVTEFTGIKSNPVIEDVNAAAKIGIQNGTELVVAVGGGSVIDSAKIIAICISEKCDGWDVMKMRIKVNSALPLIAVLTLAATGTEMNNVAVLQNTETMEKIGFRHDLMFPKHSFLDPSFTLTVPLNYTAYGIVDLISHTLEAYFGKGDASLSDKFATSIIMEAMEYGPALMKNPNDYLLRAKIMWAATNALNGLTNYGRLAGDWGVHAIGHNLSFLYDTPHGASLSIVYPAWLKIMKNRIPARIAELGQALFGINDADETINQLEAFFKELGAPVRLKDIQIGPENYEDILQILNKNRSTGSVHILTTDDRKAILDEML